MVCNEMNIHFISLVHVDLIKYIHVNGSIPRNPYFIIIMQQLHVRKTWDLFDRSKGHGSGCTTALSGVHCYFELCVLSNAALPVLWQFPEPAQLISDSSTKLVPASKIKAQSASNTSTLWSMSTISWFLSFPFFIAVKSLHTRSREVFGYTRVCGSE